jgi:hypothetical protein
MKYPLGEQPITILPLQTTTFKDFELFILGMFLHGNILAVTEHEQGKDVTSRRCDYRELHKAT